MKGLIIGCGFCGASAARYLAEMGWQITIADRRPHIGGNAYDCVNKQGIRYHVYGPHVFFTDSQDIWAFVSRFSKWEAYRCQAAAKIDGQFFRMPFRPADFSHMMQDIPRKLPDVLQEEFPGQNMVSLLELQLCKNPIVREWAQLLYEKDYLPYNQKQWGLTPQQIAPEVIGRVPIRLDGSVNFRCEKYQYMPADGFTKVFEQMLNHDNIQICTETYAGDLFQITNGALVFKKERFDAVLYTGRLDELTAFCFGRLPYRTLRFSKKEAHAEEGLPCLAVYEPGLDSPYTRTADYHHLPENRTRDMTLLISEKPDVCNAGDEPYYVVLTDASKKLYGKYLSVVKRISHFYTAGRLADFRYLNMDDTIRCGLEIAKEMAYREGAINR